MSKLMTWGDSHSVILSSQHIIAARKCLKLLIQIIQNVSTTMWGTADTRMDANSNIPKRIVIVKHAAQENVLKDTEGVADMVENVKEEKAVNFFTRNRTAICIYQVLKLKWRV